MADELLSHDDFNRLAAQMFNNRYDAGSVAVLNADLKIAEASGDARAAASIKRDLARAESEMANPTTTPTPTSTPVSTSSGSPVPELQTQLNDFMAFGRDVTSAIFAGEQERQKQTALQSQYTTQQAQSLAAATIDQANMQIIEDETHRQLLRAVGLDINDPSSFLNQELAREQTARREREQIRSRLTELNSVSFFENPFAFMMNQPEIRKLTAKHNELADVENTSTEEIARMQSLATTISNLTPVKNADLLRNTAQHQAEAVVSKAQAVAAEISAQNAAGNARALLDSFTIQKNIFGDILQLRSMEEGIKDRRQRIEDSNFWRGLAAADRKEKMEEKAAREKQEAAIVVGLNTYRRAISGNTTDFTLEDVKRMPQNVREAWYNVILRGNYGNSYTESVPFISTFGDPAAAANSGNATMMYTVRSIKDRAMKMVPQLINAARAQGQNLKESDALQRAYETIYNEDRNYAIKGADKSRLAGANPYALDWDAISSSVIASKGTGVVASVLADSRAREPGTLLANSMTPRNFFAQVEAKVLSKQVSPKEAAQDVAQFFALQSARQYEQAGLKYLALPELKDWTITPGASGNERVDLMNPTQIENYLTARVAASARASRAGLNNPFVPFR